jgi:hypothetical protein
MQLIKTAHDALIDAKKRVEVGRRLESLMKRVLSDFVGLSEEQADEFVKNELNQMESYAAV